ncbi:hypothetical protein ACM16X_02490 [Haloarcula japonica]|uniref:hypothetical protein n=1 Tax=Haloarcula japonica TaxID=29282 RepID=UPI0039F70F9C
MGNEVYYLQYLNEDHEYKDDAEDFFLSAGSIDPEVSYVTRAGFDTMWEKVGETELEDLDEIYREWNGVGTDLKDRTDEVDRPMWDGDIVEIDDQYFMYQGDGFHEVQIVKGSEPGLW